MSFIKEFFRNTTQTGAIAPSSRALTNLIVDTAQLGNKKCVVEFGTGNGVFTEKILQKKDSDCVFFSIEINDKFVAKTIRRCPTAIVYHDSAENIQKYVSKHNKNNCDCIISSLPWASFDKNLQNRLLEAAYNSLEEGGFFLTFAYIQGLFLPSGKNFKKLLKSKFNTVNKTKIIWWNLFPAFVYYCKK